MSKFANVGLITSCIFAAISAIVEQKQKCDINERISKLEQEIEK